MIKHCGHDGCSDGQEVGLVIEYLLQTRSEVAHDIQRIFEGRHSDFESAIMRLETELKPAETGLYYFGRFAQALRMTGINVGGMTPIFGNGIFTVTPGDASNHTSLKGSF